MESEPKHARIQKRAFWPINAWDPDRGANAAVASPTFSTLGTLDVSNILKN